MINLAGANPSSDVSSYLKIAQDFFERSIAKRPMAESYILLTAIYGRAIAADPSIGTVAGHGDSTGHCCGPRIGT